MSLWIRLDYSRNNPVRQTVPPAQLYSVSKLGKLIWEPSLFDNSLWRDRDLTEGILLWGGSNSKLSDGLDDHFLCCGVLTDHDVSALLVSLENSQYLIWQVLGEEKAHRSRKNVNGWQCDSTWLKDKWKTFTHEHICKICKTHTKTRAYMHL